MTVEHSTKKRRPGNVLGADSQRVLAREIVKRLYPKELPVFDMVADAFIESGGLLPAGTDGRPGIGGLPYGAVGDLATPQIVAYVGTAFLIIAELCTQRSIPVEEAHRLFVIDPTARERLLEEAQHPLPEGLRLDPQTRRDLLEHVLDWIGPLKFYYGEPMSEGESARFEYKKTGGGNPVRAILDECEKYAVGFLNAEGGSIFWGIEPKALRVTGIVLNLKSRDELQIGIARELARIRPAIDPTLAYHMRIHPVFGAEKVRQDLWVVELSVALATRSVLYRCHNGKAYARLGSATRELTEDEIHERERGREPYCSPYQ